MANRGVGDGLPQRAFWAKRNHTPQNTPLMPRFARVSASAAAFLCALAVSHAAWLTPSPVRLAWQRQPCNSSASVVLPCQPELTAVRQSTGIDDGQLYPLLTTGTWCVDRTFALPSSLHLYTVRLKV